MEKAPVNFDIKVMNKAVKAYVRSKAILHGSFIAYKKNGQIVKEDPLTGIKTIVQSVTKR